MIRVTSIRGRQDSREDRPMKAKTFKPWDIALLTVHPAISSRKRLVEIVSYPFGGTDPVHGGELVKVRMVPGEPTTLADAAIKNLQPWPNAKGDVRYLHVAEVMTTFPFPEDMLRYDSAALFDHTQPEEPEDEMGRLTFRPTEPVLIYRLSRVRKGHIWTTGRWASFSASCRHVLTRDLKEDKVVYSAAAERRKS
jgi:hypothetical protein